MGGFRNRVAATRKSAFCRSQARDERGETRHSATSQTPDAFQQVESLIVTNFNNSDNVGGRLDWEQIEGCWVLRPPASAGPPEALALFLGGAFVGAAPELSYKLFLETLAARNVLVITVPYATGFDQLRIADEIQFKIDRCMRACTDEVRGLPIYGIGHSLGALLTLLISARFAVHRDGNALLSFNNRPATDVIPFLSPFIAPGARTLAPLLSQMATSPMRPSIDSAVDSLRSLSPTLFKMAMPVVEQLAPVFMDVSQGRQEFSPSPEEASNMIRTYYSVNRNLLIRFKDDGIDETPRLTSLLQKEAAISGNVDLMVRTLPGDHTRPLAQNFVDLPPDVARLANSSIKAGGSLLGDLSRSANNMGWHEMEGPLKDLGRQVTSMSSLVGGSTGGPITDSTQALADEVAAWMGVGNVVISGPRALPAPEAQAAAAATRP